MLNPGSKMSQFGRGRIREFKSDPFNKKLLWVVTENGLLLTDGNSFKSYFPSPSKTIEFKDQNILLGNASSCAEINYNSFRKAGAIYLNKLKKSPFDSILILKNMKSIRPDFQFLLPETRVYKLVRDESGTIWMATNSGIFSVQYDKVIYHREKNPDFGFPFQTMCMLGNGTLAAGSNGRGILLIMPNGKTHWIKRKQGLVSNYFRNLKAQGNDSLWACTPAGLNLISTRFGAGCLNIRTWTSANSGLLSNDVFDVAVHRDSLWLAGGSEIICIPSYRESSNFSTPRAEAELVRVNGIKQSTNKNLIVEDEGSNHLLIQLRNPDYRNQGTIGFQYRLLPADTLWKMVQGNEIREFMNKPGDYDVEIRRILNKVPEKGYSLMRITVNPGLKSISNLKSIDWNIRLPLFVLLSVLLLAVFLELNFSTKTSSPNEEDPDSIWKNTGKLQRYLFSQQGQPGFEAVQDKFFAFRTILAGDKGQETGLRDEFRLCQQYLLILNQLNPDFQVELKKPEESEEIQLNLEGHPILLVLMKVFQLPPASGNYTLKTALIDNEMDVVLRNNTTSLLVLQTKITGKKKPGFFSLPARIFSQLLP
jgi:hypothetical protein